LLAKEREEAEKKEVEEKRRMGEGERSAEVIHDHVKEEDSRV
jgi:hypothetical protein